MANSVLNKGKSAIPSLEVLLSASHKVKSFSKKFSKNFDLDGSAVTLPVLPSRTNLKKHNTSLTPKMFRKVILSLDSSKTSDPDCIPVVVLRKVVVLPSSLNFYTY